MANNIDAQLEHERKVHRIRLFFRQRMNFFGNWMIPAVLWAFLFYLAIWDSEAGLSQFATTMILVPPLVLALLVLAKHQWLQENLSGWVGAKLLSRLESMNQSASKQIGILLLLVIALTFIGLRGLVEFSAWVLLIGFLAQLLPSFQQWLLEEPNLTRPPTRADVAADEARFRADRGEPIVEPAPTVLEATVGVSESVAADVEDTTVASEPIVELIHLPNPELVEATEKLAGARMRLQQALDTPVSQTETAEAGKARRKRTGNLRSEVTRWSRIVTERGGSPNHN